jgi:hypothetical protein
MGRRAQVATAGVLRSAQRRRADGLAGRPGETGQGGYGLRVDDDRAGPTDAALISATTAPVSFTSAEVHASATSTATADVHFAAIVCRCRCLRRRGRSHSRNCLAAIACLSGCGSSCSCDGCGTSAASARRCAGPRAGKTAAFYALPSAPADLDHAAFRSSTPRFSFAALACWGVPVDSTARRGGGVGGGGGSDGGSGGGGGGVADARDDAVDLAVPGSRVQAITAQSDPDSDGPSPVTADLDGPSPIRTKRH